MFFNYAFSHPNYSSCGSLVIIIIVFLAYNALYPWYFNKNHDCTWIWNLRCFCLADLKKGISLSVSLSVCHYLSLSLSFSLSVCLSIIHTHSLYHTHSLLKAFSKLVNRLPCRALSV